MMFLGIKPMHITFQKSSEKGKKEEEGLTTLWGGDVVQVE